MPTTVASDARTVGAELHVSLGLLVRSLRRAQPKGELTLPQTSALARLDRGGPATSAELAREEQISAQSMGATLAALEERGLIERSADPADGRRVVLAPTRAGLEVLRNRRGARAALLADALATNFTAAEVRRLQEAVPLLERLAEGL